MENPVAKRTGCGPPRRGYRAATPPVTLEPIRLNAAARQRGDRRRDAPHPDLATHSGSGVREDIKEPATLLMPPVHQSGLRRLRHPILTLDEESILRIGIDGVIRLDLLRLLPRLQSRRQPLAALGTADPTSVRVG